MNWLGLLFPAMGIVGAIAILSPIIIHLLNRRRFKIVEWAAMEFLLDADKKNRRRVKMENLILLLLRCAAMFLIGAVLAMPFLTSDAKSSFLEEQPFERIVVLDDSFSQSVVNGDETLFETAKKNLSKTISAIANENSRDLLSIYLTSDPDTPVLSNQPVTADTQSTLISAVDEIKVSDKTASMDVALQKIDRVISGMKKNVDRIVYVMTDMREKDWLDESTEGNDNSARNLVKAISEKVTGCYMIDTGVPNSNNLSVVSIVPDASLQSGVYARFTVTVANNGLDAVENVRVQLVVNKGVPDEEVIDRIEAGQVATASFGFKRRIQDELDDDDTSAENIPNMIGMRVEAEVISDNGESDVLAADSKMYYAARLMQGNPILVVDGDPSLDLLSSESIFLRRGLSPEGPEASGNLVETISYADFETATLSKYQAIFLCNVAEISDKKLGELEKWTEAGGGLVIFPGDTIDPNAFTKQFYKEGRGLSPINLLDIDGDVDEGSWVQFELGEATHPVLGVFEGQNNQFLNGVKIFSWWNTEMPKETPAGTMPINVWATLSNEYTTPAFAERAYGEGKVVCATFAADQDWTDWPASFSYIIALQEMSRYMCGDIAGDSELSISQPLGYAVDLALYDKDATLTDPSNEKFSVQAAPKAGADEESQQIWYVNYADSERSGFYELKLNGNNGDVQSVLYAANRDPSEGKLRRLNLDSLGENYFGPKTKIVKSVSMAEQNVKGQQNELWRYLLYLLGAILGLELILGLIFGMKRR